MVKSFSCHNIILSSMIWVQFTEHCQACNRHTINDTLDASQASNAKTENSSWLITGAWMTKLIHVKIHVRKQKISNMASDWLVAVMPASQMIGLKIYVN